jgi:hypothetical protein
MRVYESPAASRSRCIAVESCCLLFRRRALIAFCCPAYDDANGWDVTLMRLHSSVGTRARISKSSARRAMEIRKKCKAGECSCSLLYSCGWTRQINPNHSLTQCSLCLFIYLSVVNTPDIFTLRCHSNENQIIRFDVLKLSTEMIK